MNKKIIISEITLRRFETTTKNSDGREFIHTMFVSFDYVINDHYLTGEIELSDDMSNAVMGILRSSIHQELNND
jgi:hypothetical protein